MPFLSFVRCLFGWLLLGGGLLLAVPGQAQLIGSGPGGGGSPAGLGQGLVPDSAEVAALQALYQSTHGSNWEQHRNWPTDTTIAWADKFTTQDAARWDGVEVTNGDVTGLALAKNNLAGQLPARLGALTQLRSLQLTENRIGGTLPAEWATLTGLEQVEVSKNQLTGDFPLVTTTWVKLGMLALAHNQLTGPLPDGTVNLGNWVGLNQLDLSGNQLTGSLNLPFDQLLSLQGLYLAGNLLSGALPTDLYQAEELRNLDLSGNRFSGPLPASWAGCGRLQTLRLTHNQLSGAIPPGLAQLSALWLVDVGQNQLTGQVPAFAGYSQQLSTSGPVAVSQVLADDNAFTDLGDFRTLTGSAAPGGLRRQLTLSVRGNQLPPRPITRNLDGPGSCPFAFAYDHQRPQEPAQTIAYLLLQTLTLQRTLAADYATGLQWERQLGGAWVEMPGATLASLRIRPATAASRGLYRLRYADSWATQQPTFYSQALLLDLLPYAPLTQNRPDDANQGPALLPPPPAPDAHATAPADVNYVRSWVPRVALTDPARVAQAPVEQAARSTEYLDGLGRPLQTVQHQASPGHRDLVQAHAYDALGREPRQYLPYAADTTRADTSRHVGPAGYHYRALLDQQRFYAPRPAVGPPTPTDPTAGIARTGVAYGETVFEASALGRVLVQAAPGESWQLATGHGQQQLERPNTLADSVLRFRPGAGPTDPGYQGLYAAGELWGAQTTDEHGFRSRSWKNQFGQVVVRQVETVAAPSPLVELRNTRWLRTCYAFDDFGRLRYVLQPEASKRVLTQRGSQAGALPATAAPFVFHYRYDGRGRQTAKQVPGQDGETVVVYDQLDRPILSQDAGQRQRREWSWTKYDVLGRVVLTGLVGRADTLGQMSLQALATADTATTHQYEQRVAMSATYPHGLTTDQSFPRLGQQGFAHGQVLTATYYDDYDFDNDGQPDAQYDTSQDGQFPAGAAPVADAQRTAGQATHTRTRVLGVAEKDAQQAAWLTSTTFYDARARPVQVQGTNARYGQELVTTQLDFAGQVRQSVSTHQGPNHDPVLVREQFRYDHAGRPTSTWQQLPGEARAARVDSVQYNELGQVTRRVLGTGRLRQNVDYAYNIRGWLTSLNDPQVPDPADLFSLSLHYERGFTPGYEQYNGNLTGQTWRGRDGVQRAYGYVYDPLSRLRQGDYAARAGGVAGTLGSGQPWSQELNRYGLSFLSYDDNGNLATLRRQGLLKPGTRLTSPQYGPVDHLTYAYQGNRLRAVDDQVTGNQLPQPPSYHGSPTGAAGDFQEAGTHLSQEYGYDAAGNLTHDWNKNLTGIAYNHLNLPRQLHFGSGADSLVYRYAASGQKVAKLVYQTGRPVQRTDYLGAFQYESDSLRFFPHAQGRVLRTVSRDAASQPTVGYVREYTIKDHLGNLRLAYRAGQVRTLLAGLEPADAAHETQQFDSLSVSPPIAQATTLARTGDYAARLNAGGSAPQPLGPLAQLAVQKGDTLQVWAPGYYPQRVSNSGFAFSLLSYVTGLLQPSQANAPPTGADGGRRQSLPLLQVGLSAGLPALPQLNHGVPKGYLRVLFFNTDSVLVAQRTLQLSEQAGQGYEVLATGPLPVWQDGYATVYVGNESPVDVYFDDVQVEHRPGLQVQQVHYDPAGLELAGLSPASPGIRGLNNYRFNGRELQAELGLGWNHQDWRFFDPQLLRWHSVDPELENGQESWTPYAFGYDNAVRFADADGRYPDGPGDGEGVSLPNPIVSTFVGIGLSLINSVFILGELASGGSNPAYLPGIGFNFRASIGEDGIQYGYRLPATSNRELAGYLLSDGLDVGSAALTVYTAGGSGVALRALPSGAGLLLEQGGGKIVQNELVQAGKKAFAPLAEEGRLVLYRRGQPQTKIASGWEPGDKMIQFHGTGSAKTDWKINSGGVRKEARRNQPIRDSYVRPDGTQIPARKFDKATGRIQGEFLNAERNALEYLGYTYDPATHLYMPPTPR